MTEESTTITADHALAELQLQAIAKDSPRFFETISRAVLLLWAFPQQFESQPADNRTATFLPLPLWLSIVDAENPGHF
jgi:hypothetical protein